MGTVTLPTKQALIDAYTQTLQGRHLKEYIDTRSAIVDALMKKAKSGILTVNFVFTDTPSVTFYENSGPYGRAVDPTLDFVYLPMLKDMTVYTNILNDLRAMGYDSVYEYHVYGKFSPKQAEQAAYPAFQVVNAP